MRVGRALPISASSGAHTALALGECDVQERGRGRRARILFKAHRGLLSRLPPRPLERPLDSMREDFEWSILGRPLSTHNVLREERKVAALFDTEDAASKAVDITNRMLVRDGDTSCLRLVQAKLDTPSKP
jgi:ketosteroid isomerase-like protein